MVAIVITIVSMFIGYALYERATKDKNNTGIVLGTSIMLVSVTYLWYLLGTTKELAAILLFGTIFIIKSYQTITTATLREDWLVTFTLYSIYLAAFCLGYTL